EDPRRGLRGAASLAHDVQVLVRPLTRLGVVVVQVERMRLGLLQEVNDVGILVRALGKTFSLLLCRARGGPRDQNDSDREPHGDHLRARISKDASPGPGFMKLMKMRPSDSLKTWDGTLQATSS